MRNLVELVSNEIWLGKFPLENPKFLEKYLSWLHNPEVEQFIGPVSEKTAEDVKQMLAENEDDERMKHWCIYLGVLPSKEIPVGDFSLKTPVEENEFLKHDPDFYNFPRSEELTILVGQEYSGKGIGKRAMKLALDYAFDKAGTNAVYLGVRTINVRGIKLFRKCNFTELGKCKDSDGKEELIMRLTPKEWEKSHGNL